MTVPPIHVPPPGAKATKQAAPGPTPNRSKEVPVTVPLSERPLVDLLADLAESGQCQYDPELHMGPDAFAIESATARQAREDVAKEICESCPVADVCLECALRTRPTCGIWAGMRAREIAALAGQVRRETREVA